MSSTWGNLVKISIFGESHGPVVGVTIDGLPEGEKIDFKQINMQMFRRKPGKDISSSQRKEEDNFNILSGVLNETTTGAPLCAIIENSNPIHSDYKNICDMVRPGHADYTANVKYKGFNDIRGGGHFSGRLTAPLTFAGAVCNQILNRRGIYIGAHIYSIGSVLDTPFSNLNLNENTLKELCSKNFSLIKHELEQEIRQEIEDARLSQDSIGGIIECAIIGVPAGVGGPMFGGIENVISSIVFGIPAVKGIEFGAGFKCAKMKGSEHNDEFMYKDGEVLTKTNNHGGILGGISSGMPIIFRAAIKPTPSISKPQKSINISTKKEEVICVNGRHDPCIVPRAVPVIEAAASLAIINLLKEANLI